MKDIVILGGPNGAGETTAAQVLVPRELGLLEFVNADEIARGLSPFNVEGVALRRVEQRIAEGGHAIPPAVVSRRYVSGIVNMRNLYLPSADIAAIYDNSNRARTLIADKAQGEPLIVRDPARWAAIEEEKA